MTEILIKISQTWARERRRRHADIALFKNDNCFALVPCINCTRSYRFWFVIQSAAIQFSWHFVFTESAICLLLLWLTFKYVNNMENGWWEKSTWINVWFVATGFSSELGYAPFSKDSATENDFVIVITKWWFRGTKKKENLISNWSVCLLAIWC